MQRSEEFLPTVNPALRCRSTFTTTMLRDVQLRRTLFAVRNVVCQEQIEMYAGVAWRKKNGDDPQRDCMIMGRLVWIHQATEH